MEKKQAEVEMQDNLETIKSFLLKDRNIVKARAEEIRCGDGRPTPEQSNGSVRVFGGDFGVMLAVMGAFWEKGVRDIDVEKFINIYEESVKDQRGDNPKLFAHTDTHAIKDGGIGCGHARLASDPENEGKYVVPSELAGNLFSAILNRPELAFQELKGGHEEQAVFLVYSEKGEDGKRFTINSKDEDGHSFFVVNMNALHDHFEGIVLHFSRELGIELDVEDVMNVYEKQQNESAKSLAFSKGLDAFAVVIDGNGEAKIKEKLEATV